MALADITFRGILEGYKFSPETLKTKNLNSGPVTLYFCGEHAGEHLEGKVENGVLNGEATIYNSNNQELFELNIANGKITGEYTQYVNGRIRRKGLLVDCKRQGNGSEYDLSGLSNRFFSGFLIYDGYYDDDKPTYSEFDFPTKEDVKYKCNYEKTRGTIIRKRVDNPCYELEVDLKNKPIRFRYVDGDKSLLLRLYLSDNMMFEYANGKVVYEGDFIHDPLKDFRRKGMSDKAYEISLSQPRSIPEKEIESVTVSTKPLEGYLVVTDPFKVIEDPEEKKRIEEEKRKAEEEKKRIEEKKKGFEKKIMEIVDRMIQIEDSNWKEITDPKGYSIRIGPKSDDSTAGMYAIYHNGIRMRIGTTKDGIMHGRELGFDDKGSLVYQTEYENGIEKRRWLIKGGKITAVKEYDTADIS